MALESTPGEAFLTAGATDDDFAALDSMAFTGSARSQLGAGAPATGGGGGGGIGAIGDGRDSGFAGVSESLFDRIRARAAEQQKQSVNQTTQAPQLQQAQRPPSQEPAQPSSQEQQQHSAFVSQQHQASSEPTMEFNPGSNVGMFDAAVAGVGAPSVRQINPGGNNETTYSFSTSGGGEDFSQVAAAAPSPLRVPQYGASRDDPFYTALSSNHQQSASIQDKAAAALAHTGGAVKSLWDAGVGGAKAVGAMARGRMGAGGEGAGGGGGRSYTNKFLLGEDGLEEGGNSAAAAMSHPPPPPVAAAMPEASSGAATDQAYSMIKYGRTFCEDLIGFVMQLPLWGKGLVAIIVLWFIYLLFG